IPSSGTEIFFAGGTPIHRWNSPPRAGRLCSSRPPVRPLRSIGFYVLENTVRNWIFGSPHFYSQNRGYLPPKYRVLSHPSAQRHGKRPSIVPYWAYFHWFGPGPIVRSALPDRPYRAPFLY